MSAREKARLDRAKTSSAAVKSSPPSTSTLWKITHTSANSARPTPTVPRMSVTNDVRDCICARARDWSGTRYGRSRRDSVTSATLHLEATATGTQHDLPQPQQRPGPEDLHR